MDCQYLSGVDSKFCTSVFISYHVGINYLTYCNRILFALTTNLHRIGKWKIYLYEPTNTAFFTSIFK